VTAVTDVNKMDMTCQGGKEYPADNEKKEV
jgi:hypothetical protein